MYSVEREWRSGPGKPPEGPARFQSPLFFDTTQSFGEQVLDVKRNNILGREVNHKLSRGVQFYGDLVSEQWLWGWRECYGKMLVKGHKPSVIR